ncbi:MAG TPA: L-threonylcarbamoyladenylate synthase [Candidatus Dormibacteraeota bacterium]|nr:L-threonylcarbamoyladenylate synthase [Candidatus Dormibacteraeota bacterium]
MDRLSPDPAGLARAARLLREGEVIAFPTDTVYGLAALARDARACERIFEIKGRERSRQLIAMVADPKALDPLVTVTGRARWFMDRWWPGPLTLVLPTRSGRPPTLGVRIPDHPVALALLRAVGEPLATTSCNRSGAPPALTAEEASRLEGLAAVLDGGRAPGGQASTVLSLVGPEAEVLRQGPIGEREALLHDASWAFRSFAEREADGTSPLYAAIGAAVAERPEVLALLLEAQPGQRRPELLLAAVHRLLQGGHRHPLAVYYPSLGGLDPAGPRAAELFCEFALAHRAQVRELMRARSVRPDGVCHCPGLVLGLTRLAPPLALIEVGAGAGFRLNLDRYAYDYGSDRRLGPGEADLVLRCQLRGERPPELPQRIPEIVWRLGIDPSPLDPRDPETARWLRALVWPELAERRRWLEAALRIGRRCSSQVRSGDALEVLPALVGEMPQGATRVVLHADAPLDRAGRARLRELCRELQLHELALEPASAEGSAYDLLLDGERLARVDRHGAWVEWGSRPASPGGEARSPGRPDGGEG